KLRWNAIPLTACALLAAGALAQEQPNKIPPTNPPPPTVKDQDKDHRDEVQGRVWRATKLIDCKVKDVKGDKIGEIEDLIIDKDALDKNRLKARGMCRASKVIGMNVEDSAGKGLGDIDEVVLDDASGRVVYAVLSFGGFLGMGDKLFAIPWDALKPSAKSDDK